VWPYFLNERPRDPCVGACRELNAHGDAAEQGVEADKAPSRRHNSREGGAACAFRAPGALPLNAGVRRTERETGRVKARRGLAMIATLLAVLNVALLVDLGAHPGRIAAAPRPMWAVVAAALLALLAGSAVLAAHDFWRGYARSSFTGTVLFGLMAVSGSLKWWLEGAPSPLLRGTVIALWICLAVIAAGRPGEIVEQMPERAVEQ